MGIDICWYWILMDIKEGKYGLRPKYGGNMAYGRNMGIDIC
jgi:hypothetical protein